MLISPAKNLDYDSPLSSDKSSEPDFLDQAETLVKVLRELSPPQLGKLMGISNKLADLNFGRYLNWQRPFNAANSRQALLAFNGDVYTGIDAHSLKARDLDFAQQHLRILSGLYGLLRPLDRMQAYRLEMGTKLANPAGKDLYAYWGDTLTEAINAQLNALNSHTLVNLASNEYFKAVKPKKLHAEVITPVFKDFKGGKYKVVSFFAKKARGLMVRYIIDKRITEVEKIKDFDAAGYRFDPAQSSANEWVFTRKEQ